MVGVLRRPRQRLEDKLSNSRRAVSSVAIPGELPECLRRAMQVGARRQMKTVATNRKVRVLITALRDGVLVPRPEFQRRLVWSNRHKQAFLDTVLKGYPFPEIYIAAGDVDP